MEHEMEVIEKEQTPKSDASDAGTAAKLRRKEPGAFRVGLNEKSSGLIEQDDGTCWKRASLLRLNSALFQARVLPFCAQSNEFRSTHLSVPGNRCPLLLQDYWKKTGKAEEFFDMVATIQARRLNDQRADFAGSEAASEENPGISEDQLYDTILAHQSQRLEDQRTEPPIPVGIQGLLDLLLSAQGTRMEDQRSALPPGLAAPPLLGRQPSFLHGV